MNAIATQEIKRRGIGAVDELLGAGPVYVIKNNTPSYVVMDERDYAGLLDELTAARIALSEADAAAGRVKRGSATKLMNELLNHAAA